MNTDTDDDLEAILRTLPLRQPSAALDRRVAAAGRPWAGRPWAGRRWAAAAAIAVGVGATWVVVRPSPKPPVADVPAGPVAVERVTSRTVDDGFVTVTDHVPYRRVVRQTVREIWWADPATGARLWAEVPGDDQVTVEPAETF